MTKEEIKKELINICNRNNKETALKLIKEKYVDCSVDLDYHYSNDRRQKMFMGMFLWEDFNISF